MTYNFLSLVDASYLTSSIPTILGALLAVILPLSIALFIARHRSWFAAIWFIPAVLLTFNFLVENVSTISNFFNSNNEFLNGFLEGFKIAVAPSLGFHEILISLLGKIAPNSNGYINFLKNDIFAFVLYDVLFLLFFIFFRKRKKGKKKVKRYSDDF